MGGLVPILPSSWEWNDWSMAKSAEDLQWYIMVCMRCSSSRASSLSSSSLASTYRATREQVARAVLAREQLELYSRASGRHYSIIMRMRAGYEKPTSIFWDKRGTWLAFSFFTQDQADVCSTCENPPQKTKSANKIRMCKYCIFRCQLAHKEQIDDWDHHPCIITQIHSVRRTDAGYEKRT